MFTRGHFLIFQQTTIIARHFSGIANCPWRWEGGIGNSPGLRIIPKKKKKESYSRCKVVVGCFAEIYRHDLWDSHPLL